MSSIDWSSVSWRKSTRSDSEGGNCVEVAAAAEVVGLRDSKNPNAARLVVGRATFRALAHELKSADLQ